jgi:hypothetical protein
MKLNLVPARTGMTWVRQGLRAFWRMPLAFAGLFLMCAAALTVLSGIPLVGPLLAAALAPAATAGLMAATRQAEQGSVPLPGTLLAAFRQSPRQTRAILLLGAINAAALLAISGLIAALMGENPVVRLIEQSGGQITPELLVNQPELMINNPAWHAAVHGWMRQTALACLLYLPVSALLWHAPALALWHGLPVGKSLFFSAVAVLRNAPAYLLYGLGWMAVSSIACAGLLIASVMIGNPLPVAVGGTLPLAALVMGMFYTSLWFTFRDSFTEDAPPAGAPPSTNIDHVKQ